MSVRKRRYYESHSRGLDPTLVARYYRLVGPVKTVLDVGCGQGCIGKWKPSVQITVHGIDHDAGAVEQASSYEMARRLELDSDSLPYPDAMFDAVFAKDILEHLRDPSRLLLEFSRVLRSGGRLVVSVPMEFPWVVWNDYTHLRGFTRGACRLLLEDAGFEVIHVVPMGGIPLFGRLGLVDQLPRVLRIPGMRRLFGRSWEALAVKRDGAQGPGGEAAR